MESWAGPGNEANIAYCEDITALTPVTNTSCLKIFSWVRETPEVGTGKTTVSINRKAEEIFYKIASCIGVKACSASRCSYVTSTQESKQCPHHQKPQLQSLGSCPVDFFHVWPTASEDNRRWIGWLVWSDDMLADNLRNHPINPPSKIPVKEESRCKEGNSS